MEQEVIDYTDTLLIDLNFENVMNELNWKTDLIQEWSHIFLIESRNVLYILRGGVAHAFSLSIF